jgi:hypothetical protein
MPKEYDPTTNKLVKGCFWPFAAIRNIKNGINPMAASERKAVIGQPLISLAWMTASGHEPLFVLNAKLTGTAA